MSDELARRHLERLVPLQEASIETNDRLGEVKREARADGLSLEAINALLPLLNKYPHDKAARVLNEIIRYAEAYGTEGLVVKGSSEPGDSIGEAAGRAVAREEESTPRVSSMNVRPRQPGLVRLPVWTQVAASLSITFGLLWLLN